MDLINILRELGLSKKEAEVYLVLLKLGKEGATRISSVSGVNRVTVYGLLNSLKQKGFVTSLQVDNKNLFVPLEPKKIMDLIRRKEDKFVEVLQDLEKLERSHDSESSIEIYQGSKGITEVLQDILDNAKTIYVYGNRIIGEKLIEFESLNFRKERVKRGIKLFGISNILEDYIAKDQSWRKNSEFAISKSLDILSTWTLIYGDRVVILSFDKELVGFLIKNKKVAEMHKFTFDKIWKEAKKV